MLYLLNLHRFCMIQKIQCDQETHACTAIFYVAAPGTIDGLALAIFIIMTAVIASG